MSLRQCTLQSGTTIMVAWIEAQHAKVGHMVRLKSEPTRWWDVIVVGSVLREPEQLHHDWHNDI